MVARVEVGAHPDLEDLYRQGRELHEQWRMAKEQVQWCEQNMVLMVAHERAKAELRLMGEPTAELIHRQQHEHFSG